MKYNSLICDLTVQSVSIIGSSITGYISNNLCIIIFLIIRVSFAAVKVLDACCRFETKKIEIRKMLAHLSTGKVKSSLIKVHDQNNIGVVLWNTRLTILNHYPLTKSIQNTSIILRLLPNMIFREL